MGRGESKAIGGGWPTTIRLYGNRGSVRARTRLFRTTDLGVILETGEFAVPRWQDYVEGNLRWSADYLFQTPGTIYLAGRQMMHILAAYGMSLREGERRKLIDAYRLATRINIMAVGADGHDYDRLRREMESLVRPFEASFGQPRTRPKRQALDQILRAASVRDARGRDNPTVAMARAVAAIRRIREERLESLIAISAVIANRREALRRLRELAVFEIKTACDFLDRMLRLDPRRVTSIQAARLAQHCRLTANAISRIDFRPFRSNCVRGVREFRAIADAFDGGKIREAVTIARIPRMSFRIKKIQNDIEVIIRKITEAMLERRSRYLFAATHTDLVRIDGRLSEISEEGFERQVCEDARRRVVEAREVIAVRRIQYLGDAKDHLKAASAAL